MKHSQGTSTRPRHPISHHSQYSITNVFTAQKWIYISFCGQLLKAVFVTNFFGFLRCGEITISQPEFNPSKHISLNAVTFYETHAQLLLSYSKTDPYQKGIVIPLFKSENNTNLCPYRALTQYLELKL